METANNNFSSEAVRDLLLESKLMWWDLGNHLGPFSQPSDEHEHQQRHVQQGHRQLRGVN